MKTTLHQTVTSLFMVSFSCSLAGDFGVAEDAACTV